MIAQFCLLLVLGMSLMWGLMPRKQVTAGFFRIQMLVVLGLSVLAFLTLGRLRVLSGEPLSDQSMFVSQCSAGAIAFVAYVGSVLWTLNRRPAGTVCNFAVLALAFVNLVLSRGHGVWLATPSGAFLFLSNISTSAVLGGSVTSMLLGHWSDSTNDVDRTVEASLPLVRGSGLPPAACFGGRLVYWRTFPARRNPLHLVCHALVGGSPRPVGHRLHGR